MANPTGTGVAAGALLLPSGTAFADTAGQRGASGGSPSRSPSGGASGDPLPHAVVVYALAPEHFPEQIAFGREPVRIGDCTITATGPATRDVPQGAAPWLRDLHIVAVPVDVDAAGDYVNYVKIELLGRGAFDGEGPSAELATRGPLCFVVPPDFSPEHVIFGVGDDATALRLAGRPGWSLGPTKDPGPWCPESWAA